MKLVFFSLFLNHHQAGVADELYKILGGKFCFVELTSCNDAKGGDDYSKRTYLIKSWQSKDDYDKAMHLAKTADVCVFSGCESLPFQRERLKAGLLSFDMGERLLKRGWLNLLSPRILKMVANYHFHGWKYKPLYKLCCSAFTASDCKKLGMFRGRCYKWGYFTPVNTDQNILCTDNNIDDLRIMWCARFLTLKHPELVVELAKSLKDSGLNFHIDIFGDDKSVSKHERPFLRTKLEELIKTYRVEDRITLKGVMPNNRVIEEMRHHQIFLFTSDKKEGWGAVANESMSNGCALVASDEIGSSPYLINDGYNGLIFKSRDSTSLTTKVEWLIRHPQEMERMRINALKTMRTLWNPHNAAISLLKLIDIIQHRIETGIEEGPGSKA